jgi:hypothetical protein
MATMSLGPGDAEKDHAENNLRRDDASHRASVSFRTGRRDELALVIHVASQPSVWISCQPI